MTENRNIKVVCTNPECGYTLRTARKWIELGTPACRCGAPMESEDGTTIEPRALLPAVIEERKAKIGTAINAVLGAGAAGFIPVASYQLAHGEALTKPWLWGLVAAALGYSAPTVADWCRSWCRTSFGAWTFTGLLEGFMIATDFNGTTHVCLIGLVGINAVYAWQRVMRTAS